MRDRLGLVSPAYTVQKGMHLKMHVSDAQPSSLHQRKLWGKVLPWVQSPRLPMLLDELSA